MTSGLAYQNFLPGGEKVKFEFDEHLDGSLITAINENAVYLDGSVRMGLTNNLLNLTVAGNILGDDEKYQSFELLRGVGFLNTVVLGTRPKKFLDLALKLKKDDSTWLGFGLLFKHFQCHLELSHDAFLSSSNREGLSYILVLEGHSNFFR